MKKSISLILTIVMLFSMLIPVAGFSATADDELQCAILDANDEVVKEGSFENLAKEVTDNQTLKLYKDIKIDEEYVIGGNNITIDGDGYTISCRHNPNECYAFALAGGTSEDYSKQWSTAMPVPDREALIAELKALPAGKITLKNLVISSGGIKVLSQVHVVLDNVDIAPDDGQKTTNILCRDRVGVTIDIISGTFITNVDTHRTIGLGDSNYTDDLAFSEITLNIYGGFFETHTTQNRVIEAGDGVTLNMYGGIVINTTYKDAIKMCLAKVNLYGGIIYNNYYKGTEGQATYCIRPQAECFEDLNDPAAQKALVEQYYNRVQCTFVVGKMSDDVTGYGVKKMGVSNLELDRQLKVDGKDAFASYEYTIPSTTLAQAAIKYSATEGNGIRFTSTVSKEMIDYANSLKDEGTELTYGTVICPEDYLHSIAFSTDYLNLHGLAYKDIEADKALVTETNGDVSFQAAIAGIQAGNIARKFAAVSYVEYIIDGIAVRNYSLYDARSQSVSLCELAIAELANNQANLTADQKTILEAYAAYAKYLPAAE